MAFRETIYVRSTPEAAWEALTRPETASLLFPAPLCEMGSAPGEPVVWAAGGEVFAEGEVLEYAPPRRLAHTFRFVGEAGAATDAPSKVCYEIEEAEGLVRLTLVHEDLQAGSQTAAVCAECWPLILSSLKTLLETGRPLRGERQPDAST
jgi:uncharacterized protein YndB with AHSA1/START domain